ncbi:glycosyltransferase [Roseivivax sp. CAU 1753]
MTDAVTIVLATRNGAAHLPAQLASLRAQRGVDWRLVASDDGSTDATVAILRRFAADHPGRVRLCSGPRAGLSANFLTALSVAVAEGPGRAVAFCDQDDVWLPEKLARALARFDPGAALGLACRAVPSDAALRPLGCTGRAGPTDFASLLLGRPPGGNRLVLSPEAAARVAATVAAARAAAVPFHDWWSVLVLTGTGGRLLHDAAPGLLYRQHHGSTLGHRGGIAGVLRRARMVATGEYGRMVAANLAALDAVPLTAGAQAAIAALAAGQGAGWRAHLVRPAQALQATQTAQATRADHAATRSRPSRAISA